MPATLAATFAATFAATLAPIFAATFSAILPAILPTVAAADGLDCTFTTICSPLTDCQNHPGVPFRFNVISGVLSFITDDGLLVGTPLSHLTPPALGALFDTAPDSTILLTITGSGEAVMTTQDITQGDQLQSVSYFGTCEPGA